MLFSLAACTRAEFGGHVFVVKGGGDVKPAAGERVYLLPYADTAELRSALLKEMVSSQFAEVGPKMTESCKAAALALEAELQKNEAERQTLKSGGDISEEGCTARQKTVDAAQVAFDADVAELQKTLASLREQLSGLTKSYDDKVNSKAAALKAEAERGISLNYKLDDIGWMKVTVKNSTPYCVGETGRLSFNFFQKGIKVGTGSGYESSDTDAYGFELGCFVEANSSRQIDSVRRPEFGSAEDKLLAERHGLKTVTVLYSGYFTFDEVTAPGLMDFFELSSTSSGNRVVWSAKPVNWASIAKKDLQAPETAEIEKIKSEIAQIEATIANLNSAKNLESAKSSVKACFAAKDQLEQNLSTEASLKGYSKVIGKCNVTQQNLMEVWAATAEFEDETSMSFDIPDVAPDRDRVEERFNQLLADKDTRTADVGIDGEYQFKDVPKKKTLLYARYSDNFTEGYWLVSADIAKLEARDLNNNDLIEGDVVDDLLPASDPTRTGG